jgi:isopenicillin-N N-acyltransferase-like protein
MTQLGNTGDRRVHRVDFRIRRTHFMPSPTVFRSAAAAPGDRGLLLGRAFPDQIRRTWEFYNELFATAGAARQDVTKWGEEALEHIRALTPDLAAEIDGIARGSGLPPHQIAALNARTEILGRLGQQHPECSTVVHTPADGGPPVTTQTWDWHDGMRDNWFVWTVEHPDGRVVRTLTEYGIVGKIGVNSRGLGLHFNILGHRSDQSPEHHDPWLPVHVLARLVLDRCATLDEAKALAMGTPVAASSALTLCDYEEGRARAATVEVSPAGPALIQPGDDGYLLHTNHFLAPNLSPGETIGTQDPDTYHRFEALQKRTRPLDAPDRGALLQALTVHLAEGAALCCHAAPTAPLGQRWETLATVSLDVTTGHLAVHPGGPCTAQPLTWTQV